ncbi:MULTISPECIES: TIGR00304 family protein [Archaeoglobus]|jgi:uncharacterized protein (TIGR00304 family)|uniref:TIGR00304 family protein n=3 Tax=Archaeoglobus fulgidus TaxID=2234 RepID=O28004_ARCFU|nr:MULTISPECIES: TIGR00304 family protein [Archaeoglobus]AAB88975.1 conserved hypothetical protein [Archaeoglobus fulgidus DSM 4304]AIG99290.1 hypothetical protein AFULGI_00025780 [Archaeoglobus fulgidus DSM 8774]KUJ92824.1 MAG: hypothetical protein XD40_1979 [Archaeoglobus fulgidus]KUK06282.1 MAG: hypothetical protein XD48_1485 [Archaeoglobus fulgidus]MDI3497023.1 hypothetical protein [Archaeoglobus sp.]
MLALLSLIIILLGIYLIISGLREPFWIEEWEDEEEDEREYERRRISERRKSDEPKREVKGGGVVLIGPIPIVFGDSKYAFLSLLLAIILMLLSIAVILIS